MARTFFPFCYSAYHFWLVFDRMATVKENSHAHRNCNHLSKLITPTKDTTKHRNFVSAWYALFVCAFTRKKSKRHHIKPFTVINQFSVLHKILSFILSIHTFCCFVRLIAFHLMSFVCVHVPVKTTHMVNAYMCCVCTHHIRRNGTQWTDERKTNTFYALNI